MFDKEGMGTVVLKYFTNIFSQSNRDYSCVINLIEPVVSSSDIDVLLAAFSADEFCKAVFQMHSDKTPWPSGMNPVFFFSKNFGVFIRDYVLSSCQQWLQSAISLRLLMISPSFSFLRLEDYDFSYSFTIYF